MTINMIWILPHSAYLGISAKLKICQVSACKIGHDVALYSEGTNQPTNQPTKQPANQPTNQVPYLLKLIFSVPIHPILLKA